MRSAIVFRFWSHGRQLTLIFAYVLESKCETSILALHDAHFAKSTLAYNSKQFEVIQVDCIGQKGLASLSNLTDLVLCIRGCRSSEEMAKKG